VRDSGAPDVAIKVKPLMAFAHEPARFFKALRATADFEACDKFDNG
jgi:hypothetical protein